MQYALKGHRLKRIAIHAYEHYSDDELLALQRCQLDVIELPMTEKLAILVLVVGSLLPQMIITRSPSKMKSMQTNLILSQKQDAEFSSSH